MGRLIDDGMVLDNLSGRLESMKDLISNMPTAYDPDKVVEQLEKEKNPICREVESIMGDRQSIKIDKAIEIVKGGGVDGN